jgi:hypothetical protein
MRLKPQIRAKLVKTAARLFNFQHAHIPFAKENLPVQIRKGDRIGIDKNKPTDARRSEIERSGRAEPACSDDKNGGAGKSILAVRAKLGKKHLLSVAIHDPGAQCKIISQPPCSHRFS